MGWAMEFYTFGALPEREEDSRHDPEAEGFGPEDEQAEGGEEEKYGRWLGDDGLIGGLRDEGVSRGRAVGGIPVKVAF